MGTGELKPSATRGKEGEMEIIDTSKRTFTFSWPHQASYILQTCRILTKAEQPVGHGRFAIPSQSAGPLYCPFSESLKPTQDTQLTRSDC